MLMDENYTVDSLIKYIYKETDIAERFEIENAIQNDFQINKAFMKLYYAYKSLPKVLFRPSQNSISKVLLYSQSFSV